MTPKDFAAAAIYAQAAPKVDFDTLIRVFLAEANLSSSAYQSFQPVPGQFLWLAFEAGFFFKIEVVQEPLGPAGFESALGTPLAQMLGTDFRGIIAQNKEYVLITVGNGDGIMPTTDPKVGGFLEKLGMLPDEDVAASRQRLKVLNILIRHIFSLKDPELIHITNSEMLLEPRVYRSMMTEDLSIDLFTQPLLFSSAGRLAEGVPLGVNLLGAREILGKSLVVTETMLPVGEVMSIPGMFVKYCLHIDRIIPHGESFGTTEQEKIVITHHGKSEQHPDGQIELTVMQHSSLPAGYTSKLPEPRADAEMTTPAQPKQEEDAPTGAVSPSAPAQLPSDTELANMFRGDSKPTARAKAPKQEKASLSKLSLPNFLPQRPENPSALDSIKFYFRVVAMGFAALLVLFYIANVFG